ncbi:MAG: ADOP family duplicated permease [Acidobacteriota bacterium]
MKTSGSTPSRAPKWTSALLRFCFRGELGEAVLGDLEEGFAAIQARRTLRQAEWWYRWQALLSLASLVRHQIALTIRRPTEDPNQSANANRYRAETTLAGLLQDLRWAGRALKKKPAFATLVVLTWALGIGATTAIFSLVHGVLIEPPPYPYAERMAYTPQREKGTGLLRYYWSYSNYLDVRQRSRSFELLEGVRLGSVVLTGGDRAERAFVRYVTPRFLDMYGARPLMGRMMGALDNQVPGGHPVVLITHKIWQSYFGADPGVIGASVRLSGMPYTVIGVLNPEFEYPFGQDLGSTVDLWVPAMMAGQAHPRGDALFAERDARAFSLIGALAPGVTVEQAQDEMNRIADQLEQEHPETNQGLGIAVIHWLTSKTNPVEGPLTVLMAGSAVLLLIACFNVASLLLVRGETRKRELALRLALGAGRPRLIRQLGVEALLLALAGGLLGVLAALGGLPALLETVKGSLAVHSTQFPPSAHVSINGPVLLTALGVNLAAGLLFGVLPAWRVSRVDLRSPLSEGSRLASSGIGSRLRSGLVVMEIATATALLAISALLVHSFQQIQNADPGFLTEGVLTMRINFPQNKFSSDEELLQASQAVQRQLGALAAVEWASPWGWGRPGFGTPVRAFAPRSMPFAEERQAPRARNHLVAPGTLAQMKIPLLQGRDFASSDHLESQPVAIISQALAENLWPGKDAVGREMRAWRGGSTDPHQSPWMTVVGVASDALLGGRLQPSGNLATNCDVYLPSSQHPLQEIYFLVHTTGKLDMALLHKAVGQVDPDIPIYDVASIEQLMARREGPLRFATLLMSEFSLAALLLASLGVYGILSFTVSQRSREIGLRAALGANRSHILRHVLAQGGRLVAAGLALGVLSAWGLERILASQLPNISSANPVAVLAAAGLLTAVALSACLLPARRATRIDPVAALRE